MNLLLHLHNFNLHFPLILLLHYHPHLNVYKNAHNKINPNKFYTLYHPPHTLCNFFSGNPLFKIIMAILFVNFLHNCDQIPQYEHCKIVVNKNHTLINFHYIRDILRLILFKLNSFYFFNCKIFCVLNLKYKLIKIL